MIGKRFARWLVVAPAPQAVSFWDSPRRQWQCVCDCGTSRAVQERTLCNGRSKSCGCLRKERQQASPLTHGHSVNYSDSPTYTSWRGMRGRCLNPHASNYDRYGGRGITVCDSWNKFENFLADMGERPKGTTLDRIDNNKRYEPSNCRWAEISEQNSNQRRTVRLEINGRTQTLTEWARALGIARSTLSRRLRSGCPVDRALTAPTRSSGHRHS